jgi:lipoprotein NlpI
VYAVIFGHFTARQAGDEAEAKWFLTDSNGKLAMDWPYPAVQYLRGELNEEALLKLATNNDKRTEAHCFLGVDHMLKANKDEALAHFRWVKDHGTVSFVEYKIAIAEFDRLTSAK